MPKHQPDRRTIRFDSGITIDEGPPRLHGYTVRLEYGPIPFNGITVDDVLDHADRTFTIRGDISTQQVAELAFAKGIAFGLRLARRKQRGK